MSGELYKSFGNEVTKYPYKMDDDRAVIRPAIFGQIEQVLEGLPKWSFSDSQKQDLYDWIIWHFEDAEKMFQYEQEAREAGVPGANLTYHGIPHALDQVTYDGAVVLQALSQPGNRLRLKVSPEVVAAALTGLIRHDNGYVAGDDVPNPEDIENYAQRLSIHVAQSMNIYSRKLVENPPPDFLDAEKVHRFGSLGIHATNFPFDQGRQTEQEKLVENLGYKKVQTLLVANVCRFVDLGGQAARVDRFPFGLRALRDEFNSERPGKGDEIIGLDHEMVQKSQEFTRSTLEPQLGPIGKNLLGTTEHAFSRGWRHIPSDWLHAYWPQS